MFLFPLYHACNAPNFNCSLYTWNNVAFSAAALLFGTSASTVAAFTTWPLSAPSCLAASCASEPSPAVCCRGNSWCTAAAMAVSVSVCSRRRAADSSGCRPFRAAVIRPLTGRLMSRKADDTFTQRKVIKFFKKLPTVVTKGLFKNMYKIQNIIRLMMYPLVKRHIGLPLKTVCKDASF